MPHKHTRKGEVKDSVDLPPSQVAKPLPVSKSAKENGVFTTEVDTKRKGLSKRKRNVDKADDTPKAFQRLMMFTQGKRLPKGLDDGLRPTKKQKKADAIQNTDENVKAMETQAKVLKAEIPTIRPGEKMSEFSARVDAALPISGLMNKSGRGGKDPLGLKQYRTKKEKKMHKMYDEWREQDAKIKEKRQEALELAEEEDDDEDGGNTKWKDLDDEESTSINSKKKKGKGKRKKMLGELDDGDDDPWAALKKSRNEAKVGLHDVAQAPPELKAPKAKFKVRGGAMVEVNDVPTASGSLRKREELGAERANIIASYRQLMKARSQSS